MALHEISPSAATVHWGHFDGTLAPILTVAPGDTITINTLSGSPEDLPPAEFKATVSPNHHDVHAHATRGPGAHVMTGPVAVTGAMPGDALRVEIVDVRLRDDWAYNTLKPLLGALPDAVSETRRMHLEIDKAAKVIRTPWGLDIPAAPFFGVMGTAPPRAWGRLTSVIPRAFGGNIDNKLLGAGAVLYLPVFEPGGLFSVGDGHGVQGDGEVCLTAVETGLTGVFKIDLVKNAKLSLPRAETPTHHITMGFNEDLDDAATTALRQMIDWIDRRQQPVVRRRLSPVQPGGRSARHASGEQHKGVHVTLPKWTGLIKQ